MTKNHAESSGGPKRRLGPAGWLVCPVAARSPGTFVPSGGRASDGCGNRRGCPGLDGAVPAIGIGSNAARVAGSLRSSQGRRDRRAQTWTVRPRRNGAYGASPPTPCRRKGDWPANSRPLTRPPGFTDTPTPPGSWPPGPPARRVFAESGRPRRASRGARWRYRCSPTCRPLSTRAGCGGAVRPGPAR